jgi:hypothetical protein
VVADTIKKARTRFRISFVNNKSILSSALTAFFNYRL